MLRAKAPGSEGSFEVQLWGSGLFFFFWGGGGGGVLFMFFVWGGGSGFRVRGLGFI